MALNASNTQRKISLQERILNICKTRDWSLKWDARLAQLTLESAEFAEALRGKGGDPTEEAGDVLFVLMSMTEGNGIPWEDVVKAVTSKCEKLETAPRYHGEEYESES